MGPFESIAALRLTDAIVDMVREEPAVSPCGIFVHMECVGGCSFTCTRYEQEQLAEMAKKEQGMVDSTSLHAQSNDPEKPLRATILDTAKQLISGERSHTYGDAKDDFGRTAKMWQQVLPIADGHEITAAQVAICLGLVKVSRLTQTPNHEDSWIDACGYFGLGGEIAINATMEAIHGNH